MQDMHSILLVEDDRIDMMTVKRALKDHRIEAELVHVIHGEEALEYLRGVDCEKPCVILLDLHAPKMSGFDFLEIVKADEFLKDIPVVVFSGANEDEAIAKAFELGASDYIVKSTDYADFSKSFGSVERLWKDTSELPVKG